MLTLIRNMYKELKESTFKNKWQTNRSKVTQTRRQTEREMEIEKRTFESIFLQGISVIYKVSQKTRNPSYRAITPLLLHTKSTRNHLIGIWRDQMYCSLGQSIPKPLPHSKSRLSARRSDRAHPTIQALLRLIGGRFWLTCSQIDGSQSSYRRWFGPLIMIERRLIFGGFGLIARSFLDAKRIILYSCMSIRA